MCNLFLFFQDQKFFETIRRYVNFCWQICQNENLARNGSFSLWKFQMEQIEISNLLDWLIKKTSLMQLFFKNKMYILVIGSAYTFRYYSHCSIALRARSKICKICEIIVLYLRYFLSGRFSSRDTTPPSSSSSRISPSSRLIVSFGQTRTCFHLVSAKQSL